MSSCLTPTWIILSGSIGCCASVCTGQCRCISSARRVLPTASSTSSKPIHWTFSVKIHAISSSQLLSSTVRDSTADANFTLGKPSASARCRQSICRPERCWMKMNFGLIASCSIMARRAFEEKLRVNVWSEGLKLLRLPVGPWLSDAKRAVRRGAPDDSEIVIRPDQSIPLGVLKQHALRTARGQKIAYVVDAAYHEKNIDRIVALACGADQLFMEAPFLDMDAEVAAQRRHLTARQAGAIAKRAGVSRFVPFHFSARYRDQEDRLRCEAEQAFRE